MLRFDSNVLFTVINLLILFFFMKKFLFGRVDAIIEQRRKEVEASYQEAEEAKSQAQTAKTQYEEQVRQNEQAREEILAKAREEAADEGSRILENARQKAARETQEQRDRTRAELDRMVGDTKKEVASMVLSAFEEQEEKSCSPEHDMLLYDAFLGQVNGVNKEKRDG